MVNKILYSYGAANVISDGQEAFRLAEFYFRFFAISRLLLL
jgi:hypothetical protein